MTATLPTASAVPAAPPPVIVGAPHPALRPYVLQYLQFSYDLGPGETVRHRVSAVHQPFLALLWSGSVQVLDVGGRDAPIEPLMFSGPLPRWRDHRYAGELRSFFVHFTSAGAPVLLQLECAGLADLAVPLADVIEPTTRSAAQRWADQVMHAADFAARVEATDRFLLWLLGRGTVRSDPVAAAAARIEQAAGRVHIADLAAQSGASERTLRRHFYRQTGLAPKLFARIVRFRRAHAYLVHGPHLTYAGAAARFGYVDQAHLIRDWHEFAGEAPTRIQTEERPLDQAVDLGTG